MADFLAVLLVFLAMVGYSNAAYCICKDGTSTDLLQKNIDYACGNGADCSQILQSGSCYNPNTVKDHCSYAVNSYFQKKNSSGATCEFSGTAILSSTAPGSGSGCNYPSSAGSAGTGTSIAPPGSSTNPISTAPPGSNNFNGGLAPSGSGLGGPDSSSAGDLLLYQGSSGLLLSLAFIFLVSWLNGFIALNP